MDQPLAADALGLALDLDLAYTQARFTDYDSGGNHIPGAPDLVAVGRRRRSARGRLVRRAALAAYFGAAAADRGRQRALPHHRAVQRAARLRARERA